MPPSRSTRSYYPAAVSEATPPPPQLSADGKYYWDGQRWVPVIPYKPDRWGVELLRGFLAAPDEYQTPDSLLRRCDINHMRVVVYLGILHYHGWIDRVTEVIEPDALGHTRRHLYRLTRQGEEAARGLAATPKQVLKGTDPDQVAS